MSTNATFFTPFRSFSFAVALVFGLVALSACESAEPNIGVTIDEVEQDPQQYFGQTVTVSGEINDVYGSNAFTIGGEGFAGALLVVVPSNAEITGVDVIDTPDMDDAIVQVSGTVREFVISEIEADYGLTFETEIDYEEQEPAVVAESIWVTPRTGPAGGMMEMDTSAVGAEGDTVQGV